MSETGLQNVIDEKNQDYWNELCGSSLAKHLGIDDASPDNLAKFDNYYMDYYPYLKKHLPLNDVFGKKVLDVGLGYGTVAELLASQGANYHGLDIAKNAVEMSRHRLKQNDLQGEIRIGSMLECPFPDNYFDYVISIGCFHHTGDIKRCIDQTHRVLKDGGKAVIMVYNKFAMRQWKMWPGLTAKALMLQLAGKKQMLHSSEQQRKAYDASLAGAAAPETDFFSISDVQELFSAYKQIKVSRENYDEQPASVKFWPLPAIKKRSRMALLESRWATLLGLDLYIEAIK